MGTPSSDHTVYITGSLVVGTMPSDWISSRHSAVYITGSLLGALPSNIRGSLVGIPPSDSAVCIDQRISSGYSTI